MAKRDFLVEIGTEELPPKSLFALTEAFADGIERELSTAGIRHGKVHWFATPRRMAVMIEASPTASPISRSNGSARRSRKRSTRAGSPRRLRSVSQRHAERPSMRFSRSTVRKVGFCSSSASKRDPTRRRFFLVR